MRVTVNGEPKEIREHLSVAELLEELQANRGACAVEVNRQLVPRRQHADRRLAEGDEVEIVTLVGGG